MTPGITRLPLPTRGEATAHLRLQAVTWHVLNEASDNFNRNSLVPYAYQREHDGKMVKGSYVFTDIDATRIGNNLGWMLVNCALTKRAAARPET